MSHEWVEDAACRGVVPEFVFPRMRGEDEKADDFRERSELHAEWLRPVCAVCPVRQDCFAYSMKRRVAYGVWAGVSEYMRTRWLKSGRRWRCTKCGAPLDSFHMMTNQSLKLCEKCTDDKRKNRKGK